MKQNRIRFHRLAAVLGAAALLALCAACGQNSAAQAPDAPQKPLNTPVLAATAAPTTAPATAAPSAVPSAQPVETPDGSVDAATGRPAKATLVFEVEGMQETAEAALYVGEGWSIYIPETDWECTDADFWQSAYNTEVSLQVLYKAGQSTEQFAAVLAADGYQASDDADGVLYAAEEDMEYIAVLVEGNGGLYCLSYAYPSYAAEGFGARWKTITDTFEITQ